LEAEVRVLNDWIGRLKSAGKTVEEWKSRALDAEDQAVNFREEYGCLLDDWAAQSSLDDRFDKLRRLIAKELHPDFCDGG
jgi:hypothetical protein